MIAKVLVVDDEKSIRISLREFLKDADYSVDVAENADEAMGILKSGDIDVLVTDIIMPRLTGVDLLKSIKKTSPFVQVILMTGEPTIETSSEAVRSGAFDYLTKPIDKLQLLKTVAGAVRVKSLNDDRRRLAEENHQYRNNLEHLVEERTRALRKSESKNRLLVTNALSCIHQIDINGRLTSMNPAGLEMMGAAKESEIIGSAYLDIVADSDKNRIGRLIREALDGKQSQFEFISTNGNSFSSSFVPIFDDDNKVIQLMGLSEDITERKKAEQTTKEQARLLDLIFEHTLDSIVVLDKDYNFIRVSETYAKSCERDISEFLGRNHFEMFPSNLKDEVDEAKKGKFIYRKSARPFIFPDHPEWGTTYWDLGLVPILDADNEIELFLFTLKDVTKRKRAEQATREANERFQLAFENANIAICLVDMGGRFIMVNEQMCTMYGYTKNELEGMAIDDITHPDYLKFSPQFVKRAASGDFNNARFIKRYIHKDGHTVWGEVSSTLVKDTQGNPLHFISYLLDITERKRAEKAILDKQMQLDDLFENVDAIVLEGNPEQIYFVGGRVEEILGYPKVDWFADPNGPLGFWKKLLHSDDAAAIETCMKAIENCENHSFEYRLIAADGKAVWFYDRVTVESENGRPTKTRSVMIDITERKKAEEEMLQRKERLSLVKDMAMEITSDMSIEEVVANSLKKIFKMLPNYRVSYGYRLDDNLYRCMGSEGPSNMVNIKGTDFDMTNAPEFIEALTKGHVVTNDIMQHEMVEPLREQLKEIQVRAMINAPVLHAAGLKGLLWIDSDSPHSWSDHEITTLEDVSRFLAVAVKNAQLTEERTKTSEKLKAESAELTEKNIALNQVLEHLEREKQNYKEQISESVESLLMPVVNKLKKRSGNLSPKDIALLETSLNSIVGKEIDVFKKNIVKLSPRELDICELIREGKSSKEISSVLNLSTLTVHKHRESIRSKLQLKNKSTNLSAYLRVRESLVYNTQSVRN